MAMHRKCRGLQHRAELARWTAIGALIRTYLVGVVGVAMATGSTWVVTVASTAVVIIVIWLGRPPARAGEAGREPRRRRV
jgi:N-acyl-L-homoserine lactone synthetase